MLCRVNAKISADAVCKKGEFQLFVTGSDDRNIENVHGVANSNIMGLEWKPTRYACFCFTIFRKFY